MREVEGSYRQWLVAAGAKGLGREEMSKNMVSGIDGGLYMWWVVKLAWALPLLNGPSTTLVVGSRWPKHSDLCFMPVYRAVLVLLYNRSYINVLLISVKYLTQNFSINVCIMLVKYTSTLLKVRMIHLVCTRVTKYPMWFVKIIFQHMVEQLPNKNERK